VIGVHTVVSGSVPWWNTSAGSLWVCCVVPGRRGWRTWTTCTARWPGPRCPYRGQ